MRAVTPPEFDVLIALNYYAPYVSGLTDTARLVAEGLAALGWRVAVVAAQHDSALPLEDEINGVRVIRTPVIARIGKGTISPKLPKTVVELGRRAHVVNLHVPMLEAGLIARRLKGHPLVATYHCDVSLPPGLLNSLQVQGVDASSRATLRRAQVTVPTTLDYAEHSRLRGAVGGQLVAIAPPCRLRLGGSPTFRESSGRHVGFLGRIVEEKGLRYLVEGFLAAAGPEDRLLVGGDFAAVAGGSVIEEIRRAAGGDERVRFLGFLPDDKIADFYASLDVFALTSVNSLEAFGIVQVEAMMLGIPAIATDIPGVRTPVQQTGLGRIVPPRDSAAIAAALTELQSRPIDLAAAERVRDLFSIEATIANYAEVFAKLGAKPA